MTFTIADIGLRDREWAKFPSVVSGISLGSAVCSAVLLCGIISGTSTIIPLRCNAGGALFTISGVV
jgi:hypothetical protein